MDSPKWNWNSPPHSSISILRQDRSARQQPPKPKQKQPRLAERDVPQNACSLVARVLAQRPACRCIHEIDQAAVVGLLELVDSAAYQQMPIEFAAQRPQFAAFASIENRFGDSQRPSESGDDPAD